MHDTDRRHSVLDSLGHAVVTGEIAPGDSLTLEDIQSRYKVSRTLARDCVRTLESLGVVVSRRRVGIVVRPRENWSALAPQVVRWQLQADPRGPKLGALTELRAAIEPVAAAAAARRATEAQRSRLLTLAASIRAKGARGKVASYLEEDISFHSLVLEASHNDAFEALTGVVAEVLSGRARLTGEVEVPVAEALELHERVAHAVAAGDAETAETCMRELVAEVRAILLDRGLRGFLES
ncbi:GntR family transcriptional regulator [Actinomyces sp. Chiba101]|uniref:DNA-binding transcriptional regulator, FadR family n=1 Tax=Actinomyces denticolens TaxID=52767 RepID=A0ABY1IBG6_9ACTO|nr:MULTISPECIES: FCD domain-containing protein [Actinomyces]BAW92289.1 GntR family transcriptional regulator [Actinomyces sp. Chiba101]GAV94772.1 GntR family transcriptional regulator [Actinomyces denticolens]SHI94137.1 DNA-binding transcriptional regulator, FadR family [Actinomyces denticolens]SUU10063.1 L-lactate utilization operon repressor [Actinomyces denticolens]